MHLLDGGEASKAEIADYCGTTVKSVDEWLVGNGPFLEKAVRIAIGVGLGTIPASSSRSEREQGDPMLSPALLKARRDVLTLFMATKHGKEDRWKAFEILLSQLLLSERRTRSMTRARAEHKDMS